MSLKLADECLYTIWKQVRRLHYLNPTNQDAEEKKFFISQDYNPQFKYTPLRFDGKQLKKKLQDCKKYLDNSDVAKLINAKIDKLSVWIDLLENRGKKEFANHSINYYGKPSAALLETAKKIVTKKIKDEEVYNLRSFEIADFLREKAKEWGIPWKIEVRKNIGAKADNVTSESAIYIKEGELFSIEDAKRLAVHELGVHARRAVMGKKQPYKIFFIGTAEYECTEEGLAVTVEELKHVSSPRILKNYAGRVVAVHLSLKHSFRSVYNYLSEYFPPREAYQLTMRAKRGLIDTSKPGAFTKDYIYLKGREDIKKIKNVKKLFVGRVGIEDMPKGYFE